MTNGVSCLISKEPDWKIVDTPCDAAITSPLSSLSLYFYLTDFPISIVKKRTSSVCSKTLFDSRIKGEVAT